MKLEAISHAQEGFAVDASLVDGALTLRLLGDASLGTERVANALKKVHEEILERNLDRVMVDMRELEFMNSAGFKSFVIWLSEIVSLPPERQYRVKVLSDPGVYWQARSLLALRAFATDVLEVAPAK